MSGLLAGLGSLLGSGSTAPTLSGPTAQVHSGASTSTSTSTGTATPAANGATGSTVYILVVGYFGAGPMQTMGYYLTLADAEAAAGPMLAYSGRQAIWRVLAAPVVAQSAS